MDHVCEVLSVSQRLTCQVLDQPRSTQRHVRKVPEEKEQLVKRIVTLSMNTHESVYAYTWHAGLDLRMF